jgi:hypothetical protein
VDRTYLSYADGLDEGYPECCISAFCDDVAADRYSARLRGTVRRDGLDYVPCEACRRGTTTAS